MSIKDVITADYWKRKVQNMIDDIKHFKLSSIDFGSILSTIGTIILYWIIFNILIYLSFLFVFPIKLLSVFFIVLAIVAAVLLYGKEYNMGFMALLLSLVMLLFPLFAILYPIIEAY